MPAIVCYRNDCGNPWFLNSIQFEEITYMIIHRLSFRRCLLWIVLGICVVNLKYPIVLAEERPAAQDSPTQGKRSGSPESDYWKQFHEHYDKLSQEGRNKAEQAIEWMRQDIGNIGRWEYKIERIQAAEDSVVEQTLNAMGLERWQCYQVIEDDNGNLRLFLKRPKQSMVRAFPFKDTLNLLNQEK